MLLAMLLEEGSDEDSQDYDGDSEEDGLSSAILCASGGKEGTDDCRALFGGHFSPAKPSPGRRLFLSPQKVRASPAAAASPIGGTITPPAANASASVVDPYASPVPRQRYRSASRSRSPVVSPPMGGTTTPPA